MICGRKRLKQSSVDREMSAAKSPPLHLCKSIKLRLSRQGKYGAAGIPFSSFQAQRKKKKCPPHDSESSEFLPMRCDGHLKQQRKPAGLARQSARSDPARCLGSERDVCKPYAK